jgi:flagellar hook assembly protein FlgD
MPKSASVNLDVYDITGRLVRHVLAGTLSAGDHEVEWDGRDAWGVKAAPGAYVVRLSTADWSETGKVLRLR